MGHQITTITNTGIHSEGAVQHSADKSPVPWEPVVRRRMLLFARFGPSTVYQEPVGGQRILCRKVRI